MDEISDKVDHDDVDVRLLTRAVLVDVVKLEAEVDTAADEIDPVELLNVDVGVVVSGYKLDKVPESVVDDVALLGTE